MPIKYLKFKKLVIAAITYVNAQTFKIELQES